MTTAVPQWEPVVFSGAEDWTGAVSAQQIGEGKPSLLLDARSPERYRGELEPIDPVAGHIPGAINIPYLQNTSATGRFLPPDELRQRFAIIAGADRVVSYCGSGVTACSNLLALAIVGCDDALLYPGSWSDWCAIGGTVATGD